MRHVATRLELFLFLMLAAGLYLLVATQGSYDHLFNFSGREFDSLAMHLMHGSSQVDPDAIGFEAFNVGDKTYMYFGPWPAMLRMPGLLLIPWLYDRFGRISVTLAALLAVLGFGRFVAESLRFNVHAGPRLKRYLFWTLLMAFTIGSPIASRLIEPNQFHDASLWGLCFALWGLFFLERCLIEDDPPLSAYAGLSTCAGLALLSRITYGIPLYACVILAAMRHFAVNRSFVSEIRPFLAIFAPAGAAAAFQGWYDYDRFGSIFATCPFEFYFSKAGFMPVIERYGQFNIGRIPATLLIYFDLSLRYFSLKAPFIFERFPDPLGGYGEMFAFYALTLSLPIAVPWAALTGLFGAAELARRIKARPIIAAVAAALFLQPLLILAYHSVTDRYLLDFIPFLAFCAGAWLRVVGRSRGFLGRAAVILVFATCLAAPLINGGALISATTYKINGYITDEQRAGLRHDMEAINGALEPALVKECPRWWESCLSGAL